MTNLSKQALGGIAVTSSSPGTDKIPLGDALEALAAHAAPALEISSEGEPSQEPVESFSIKHKRYANAKRLAQVSCPHAIKAWAAERLPALGISYDFANRLPHDVTKANMDEHASLRVVQFADDLTLVARYCRHVQDLEIEAVPNSHGIEFRLYFRATPINERLREIENHAFNDLLRQNARENSIKCRVFATREQLEARLVVFRKRVRLGFSPLF